MTHHLFWPEKAVVTHAGFPDVSDVPAIFGIGWKYEVCASRYLRERATLKHESNYVHSGFRSSMRYPTERSLATYGQNLCNFLDWVEWRKADVGKLDYTSGLINGYQTDMQSGRWAASGRGLKPRTINLRVGLAADYLRWLSSRGFRDKFEVVSRVHRSVRHTSRRSTPLRGEIRARAGTVRPDPLQLRMPTDDELKRWRASLKIRRGETKLLMVDLILQTGLRREEAAQWRVDTLPLDRAKWRVLGDVVTVWISLGTKGTKRTDLDGNTHGPRRLIDLPLSLANRIDRYRQIPRAEAKAKYVREAPNTQERRRRMKSDSGRLFLGEDSGRPISAPTLYEAWTSGPTLPFKGWSPHGGRHYYACKTLMDRLQRQTIRGPHTVTSTAEEIITLVLKPQLGHISTETTQIYLRWIQRLFTDAPMHVSYVEALENICQEEQDGAA